jgi:son of sevenless-like protein
VKCDKKNGVLNKKSPESESIASSSAHHPPAFPVSKKPSLRISTKAFRSYNDLQNNMPSSSPTEFHPVNMLVVSEKTISASAPSRRTMTHRSTSSLTPDSTKLVKFFGQEVMNNVGAKEETGWFLGSNTDSRDILLSMDGNVKGGTLSALIERLTSHELLGKQ